MTTVTKPRTWEELRAAVAAKVTARSLNQSPPASPPDGTHPQFATSGVRPLSMDPAARLDRINWKASVPSLFWSDPPRSDHRWWPTMHAVRDLMLANKSACLVGPCGVGKTLMACAIIRALCHNSAGRYERTLTLSSRVRATYAEGSRITEHALLTPYKRFRFLVLDDWQWLGAPDARHRVFFEVFDTRHCNGLPTLIVMNAAGNDFAKLLGPQVTSRIEGSGGFIWCDWPSFRKPEAAAG